MNDSLVILGRQPALGMAELESLYGSERVRPVGKNAAYLRGDADSIAFNRVGSAIKLCDVIAVIKSNNWSDVLTYVRKSAKTIATQLPEGKIKLGLSAYDLRVQPNQMMATGLEIKKALRQMGRSVRLIPNKELSLNSAQVIHNHLVGATGIELVLIRDGNSIICAKTVAIQDIAAYTLRDRGRPKRDARVGMLPPKLAQTIINLATADSVQGRVLDPFCGTGVVLQEALLMDYETYGTDLEPRMVEYTQVNLEWLAETHHVSKHFELEVGDATTHQWSSPIDFVACETYLGQPFSSFPGTEKIEQIRRTCNFIIEHFLQNIEPQLSHGSRLCLAIPAWQQTSQRFIHLPFLDHLDKLGYNRLSFEHARAEDMIYYREGQIVGRELLVITRK